MLKEFDPALHPHDPETGKWAETGGGSGGDKYESAEDQHKYQTERLITDGPSEGYSRVGTVKDKNKGIWGASHEGSTAITGYTAKVMGIGGYQAGDTTKDAERLGDKFLTAIYNSRGSPETLWHGFNNPEGIKWKAGDTIKLPPLAASGEMDTITYGINYNGSDAEVARQNAGATSFEFPKGTKFAGYARWDRKTSKEFGYQWDEAIVAGEFKVVGTRTEHEFGWRNLPYTVVTLEPTGVFNPDKDSWEKL